MKALPEVLESQLLRSLREIGIPPRPLILERVVSEIRKEEPDLRTLARIIGADVGIAGGIGEGLVFRKGEILRKVPEEQLVSELFAEIDKILLERKVSR